MKKWIYLALCLPFFLNAQQKVGINQNNPAVTLDINGSMRVGNDNNNASPAGTVRFNPETGDFEGFDGNEWVSFTPNRQDFFWPAYGSRGAAGNYYPVSPQDAVQGDGFGFSVDMDGAYAVIGSPYWNASKGRVHIYKREPVFGFWNQIAVLEGDNAGDLFGYSVSISGDRILIGAPEANVGFGSAKLYFRNGNTWALESNLNPGNNNHKRYGHDVEIEGNKMAISSPKPNPAGGLFEGLVWIYHFSGFGIYTTSIVATPHPNPYPENEFGYSIGLSGEWLAVSAPYPDPIAGLERDSVFMFKQQSGNVYVHKQSLGTMASNDEFGYSVTLKNGVLFVGARNESTSPTYVNNGVCRGYFLSSDNWNEALISKANGSYGYYGTSTCVTQNYAILSAYQAVSQPSPYIQVLKQENGQYSHYLSIEDPAATPTDHLVKDVSVAGSYFVIGIPYGMSNSGQDGGRVYFGRIR